MAVHLGGCKYQDIMIVIDHSPQLNIERPYQPEGRQSGPIPQPHTEGQALHVQRDGGAQWWTKG